MSLSLFNLCIKIMHGNRVLKKRDTEIKVGTLVKGDELTPNIHMRLEDGKT